MSEFVVEFLTAVMAGISVMSLIGCVSTNFISEEVCEECGVEF